MPVSAHSLHRRVEKSGSIPEAKSLESIQCLVEPGNRAVGSRGKRDVADSGGSRRGLERLMGLFLVTGAAPGDHR
tara:strand:- start:66 stop:290 length:225 start_codon:yes stop_codon:yes gene_type:complete